MEDTIPLASLFSKLQGAAILNRDYVDLLPAVVKQYPIFSI